MSHLKSWTPAGFGQGNYESHAYVQVIRAGNILHCSGQGSRGTVGADVGGANYETSVYESLNQVDQIDQAFRNVDHILREAGGKGWEQVYKINSYHIPLDDDAQAAMVRNFWKWMPNHKAVWTCIEVPRLGGPEMRVEIEVKAHVPEA